MKIQTDFNTENKTFSNFDFQNIVHQKGTRPH